MIDGLSAGPQSMAIVAHVSCKGVVIAATAVRGKAGQELVQAIHRGDVPG